MYLKELDMLGDQLEAAFMSQTEEGSNILKSDDIDDERRKQLFKVQVKIIKVILFKYRTW